jgi:hypothetical protein
LSRHFLIVSDGLFFFFLWLSKLRSLGGHSTCIQKEWK